MENQIKKHYKMYKSGKSWCLTLVTTLSILGMGSLSVSADDGSNQVQQNQTTQTVQASNTTSNQQEIDSVNTSIESSELTFDNANATVAYAQKGVKLYKATTGDAEVTTLNDNNVQLLRKPDSVDGRVLVKLDNLGSIGYVNAGQLSDQPQVVTDSNGSSHYTRQNMDELATEKAKSDNQVPVPDNNAELSKDLVNAVNKDTNGQESKLDVWDSWPVQNTDGTVADYHGYRLSVGLTAPVAGNASFGYAKMGLFSQRISDNNNNISSWQYVGNVFDSFGEGGNANDPYLSRMVGEWSGSTVMLTPNDDTLRVMYTNFIGPDQILTTAQISVLPKTEDDWNSGLKVDHSKTTDHKSIFDGDGQYYQNASQATFGDNLTLRDPHLFYDNGQPYLLFEGSTGPASGYSGINNFYDQSYFGTKGTMYIDEASRLLANKGSKEYTSTYFSNAALGLLKLNSDFTVATPEKALLTANAVSDEFERPNIFEYNGKWYLFTVTRGFHMSSDNTDITVGNNKSIVYLLGFVSDNGMNGNYKPLNGNGLVAASDLQGDDFTYSYLVIPNADKTNNQFVVTSYLAARTFAPSFLLEINGDNTRVITNKVLDQGALVDDGNYYAATAQGIPVLNAGDTEPSNDNVPKISGYIFDGSQYDGGYRWYEGGQLYTGLRTENGYTFYFIDGVKQKASWVSAIDGKKYYANSMGALVQGWININGSDYYFGNDNTFSLHTNEYLMHDGQSVWVDGNGVASPDQAPAPEPAPAPKPAPESHQDHTGWNGYLFDEDVNDWRWFENGQLFTGFQYYTGTYYWFQDGVRQNNSFHEAWGKTYYTDADGRAVQGIQNIHGQELDFGNDGTYYLRSNGYLWDGSAENGGYRWYEDGQLYTGFRYYAGTFYWFVDGVRQNAGWRQAWGYTYYTDEDGRAVQGTRFIDGKLYNFGEDNTFYERPLTGYLWDGSAENGGYRWYENGELFTGFRYYTGTYYWFIDGVRQNAGWREAWGYKYYTDGDGRAVQGWQKIDGVDYYFGDDNTYYLR